MNRAWYIVLICLVVVVWPGYGHELPVRYEVVPAPEGFAPMGHPAEGDDGLRVACKVTRKGQGVWVTPFVMWAVGTDEVHYPSVPKGYLEDPRAFVTPDDFLLLIQPREDTFSQSQSIRYEFEQATHVLAVDNKAQHRGVVSQASRYGPFIGHVYNPKTLMSIYPAIWDDEGKLTRIKDDRYHLSTIIAAGTTYALGTLYHVVDWQEGKHNNEKHFVWSEKDGITLLPRETEDGDLLLAVDIDAQCRVLMYSCTRRVAEKQLLYTCRPYIWTKADGLVPIPFPEGWSAKPLWLNAHGHVLLDVYHPDKMPPIDPDRLQSHRLAVASIAGGEPVFLPKTLDKVYTERATGFSLSGAIAVEGGPIKWIGKNSDYASYESAGGALLVPVYAEDEEPAR